MEDIYKQVRSAEAHVRSAEVELESWCSKVVAYSTTSGANYLLEKIHQAQADLKIAQEVREEIMRDVYRQLVRRARDWDEDAWRAEVKK